MEQISSQIRMRVNPGVWECDDNATSPANLVSFFGLKKTQMPLFPSNPSGDIGVGRDGRSCN